MMRARSLLVLLLMGLIPLHASEVENPTHAGFTVTADDQSLIIRSPSGEKTTLSDETYPTSAHHGPLVCSWDPSGTWVAVFVPDKQASEIHVYDLKQGTALKRKQPPFESYPGWYQNAHAAYDSPLEWKGNTLRVLTRVTTRPDGTVRQLRQNLVINGDSFVMTP